MFRFLAAGAALWGVGCARDVDSQLFGEWKQSAQGDSLLEKLASGIMPKISLDLKPDHTFVMKLPTLEVTLSANSSSMTTVRLVEGKWRVQGRAAILQSITTGGKPVDQVRQDIAHSQARAAQEAHDRLVRDAIRKQMLAAQGYASDDSQSEQAQQPQMPSWLKSSDDLVLPKEADLSDDGRRLTIQFEGGSEQKLDLERP